MQISDIPVSTSASYAFSIAFFLLSVLFYSSMLAFVLSHFILLHFPIEACLFSNGRQTWHGYKCGGATGKCKERGIHNQDILY